MSFQNASKKSVTPRCFLTVEWANVLTLERPRRIRSLDFVQAHSLTSIDGRESGNNYHSPTICDREHTCECVRARVQKVFHNNSNQSRTHCEQSIIFRNAPTSSIHTPSYIDALKHRDLLFRFCEGSLGKEEKVAREELCIRNHGADGGIHRFPRNGEFRVEFARGVRRRALRGWTEPWKQSIPSKQKSRSVLYAWGVRWLIRR